MATTGPEMCFQSIDAGLTYSAPPLDPYSAKQFHPRGASTCIAPWVRCVICELRCRLRRHGYLDGLTFRRFHLLNTLHVGRATDKRDQLPGIRADCRYYR